MSGNIHPSAVIEKTAELGRDVVVGPNCVIDEGAVIGDGTILDANVVIGRNIKIGRNNKQQQCAGQGDTGICKQFQPGDRDQAADDPAGCDAEKDQQHQLLLAGERPQLTGLLPDSLRHLVR